MTSQFSVNEKHRILAALQVACDRACEEQDTYRRKIGDFPKPTPETAALVLDRIKKMSGEQLVEFFAGYRYPSTWVDRDLFGIRKKWDDDPYNVSQRYQTEVADEDIGCKIYHLNEWVEHRDRICLLARFYELIGFRLPDVENLLEKSNPVAEHLTILCTLVFRHKGFEWLAEQAKELLRPEDEKFFLVLVKLTKLILVAFPQLVADDNFQNRRFLDVVEFAASLQVSKRPEGSARAETRY